MTEYAWPIALPLPPATLAPDSFAARLYGALLPLAYQDPANAWALLILCNALGTEYQLVEELVRDTPDGPGWSVLVDLDRCPDWALPWLAQLVGVRLLPGSDPTEQRARIESTGGFRRGTRDALIGAAQATLTGNKNVIFRERDHPATDTPAYAYYLTVITYAAQTPDPTATRNALLAQKPAGILLDYRTATGQDWQQVKTTNATWQIVKNTYPTWAAVYTATTA